MVKHVVAGNKKKEQTAKKVTAIVTVATSSPISTGRNNWVEADVSLLV